MHKGSMKKIIYIAMAVCLAACSHSQQSRVERAPLRVKTMAVRQHTGEAFRRYVGTVVPVHETPLSMQSAGRVTAVRVKNGETVRQGQVLCEIDNTQAMNALQSAQASLRHAQDGYDRVSRVHESGVVSDQKMVEIESQLSQAQALYAAAQQQLSECTLTAPCDGVVNGLTIEIGQTVIPGVTVCSILDVAGFSVRFTVPEAEIRMITVGKTRGEAECSAAGVVLPVTVDECSMKANPLTHTYDVTAHVKGGADVLVTGMVATVRLRVENAGQAPHDIVIPATCVLLKPEGHTVWVVENGTAVRRLIEVDGFMADGVRVRSGLQEGDSLIVEGYQKLYKGCKVDVQSTKE